MTTPDLSAREGRDQLRALADAATEGPWEARECLPARPHDFAVVLPDEGRDLPAAYITDWCVTGPDAAFIAAARTAVPALLDALDTADARADRAEAALQRARDVLDTWTSRCLTEQNMHPLEPIRRALDDGDPEGKA